VRYKVSFRPTAERDLLGLYRWIAEKAGLEVAGRYVDRLEAACMALEIAPERGTRRDDIRLGIRTVGFERRATIAFRVRKREVTILRIFYGGQDFERRLKGSPEDE
jgi:toxin ParE1/3/4